MNNTVTTSSKRRVPLAVALTLIPFGRDAYPALVSARSQLRFAKTNEARRDFLSAMGMPTTKTGRNEVFGLETYVDAITAAMSGKHSDHLKAWLVGNPEIARVQVWISC